MRLVAERTATMIEVSQRCLAGRRLRSDVSLIQDLIADEVASRAKSEERLATYNYDDSGVQSQRTAIENCDGVIALLKQSLTALNRKDLPTAARLLEEASTYRNKTKKQNQRSWSRKRASLAEQWAEYQEATDEGFRQWLAEHSNVSEPVKKTSSRGGRSNRPEDY